MGFTSVWGTLRARKTAVHKTDIFPTLMELTFWWKMTNNKKKKKLKIYQRGVNTMKIKEAKEVQCAGRVRRGSLFHTARMVSRKN